MIHNVPRLVLVEWVDSAQPSPGWAFLDGDALPRLQPVKCMTAGWLVAENRHVKMVAQNIGFIVGESGEQGSGFMRIPVRAIVRITDMESKVVTRKSHKNMRKLRRR